MGGDGSNTRDLEPMSDGPRDFSTPFADALNIDYDATRTITDDESGGQYILLEDAEDHLRSGLTDRYNSPDRDFVEEVHDPLIEWKRNSAGLSARIHEKMMKCALGINRHVRKGDPGFDPEATHLEISRVLTAISMEFCAVHFGESFQLHRGLGYTVPELVSSLLNDFNATAYERPSVSVLANYTTSKRIAQDYALNKRELGIIISREINPFETALVVDHIFTVYDENGARITDAEIRLGGDDVSMVSSDEVYLVTEENELELKIALDNLTELEPSQHERMRNIVEQMANRIERAKEDPKRDVTKYLVTEEAGREKVRNWGDAYMELDESTNLEDLDEKIELICRDEK